MDSNKLSDFIYGPAESQRGTKMAAVVVVAIVVAPLWASITQKSGCDSRAEQNLGTLWILANYQAGALRVSPGRPGGGKVSHLLRPRRRRRLPCHSSAWLRVITLDEIETSTRRGRGSQVDTLNADLGAAKKSIPAQKGLSWRPARFVCLCFWPEVSAAATCCSLSIN